MTKNSAHYYALVILFVIFLTVCSCNPVQPVTILPTSTKIVPTLTRIPETPTPLSQQKIEIPDIEKFTNRITIEFWYPWAGEAAKAIDS